MSSHKRHKVVYMTSGDHSHNTSSRPLHRQKKDVFAVALMFGAVAAAAELLVLGGRRFLFEDFIWTGAHVLWMAPVSYLLLFALIGSGLALAHRVAPRLVNARAIVFVPAATAAFSLFWLWYPRISRYAIIILALGVGVQAAALLGSRIETVARFARRASIAAIAASIVLFAGVTLARKFSESRGYASLTAPRAAYPNILLIILDTVRSISTSLDPAGPAIATTPRLQAFATGGTVFEHAFATAPWTLPTHATLFTGYYPQALDIGPRRRLDAQTETLAELLARNGYATAGFVGNLAYTTRETGLARGFHEYHDYERSLGELLISSSLGWFLADNPLVRRLTGHRDIVARKTADEVTRQALDWVRDVDDRPFFAFLNYFDAHEPYLPPERFTRSYPVRPSPDRSFVTVSKRTALRAQKRSLSARERAEEEAAYHGAIAFIDEQVGALLDSLRHDGILERTIVVVTSDHGELLGEHDLFGHGHSMYLPLLQVPLIIWYPPGVAAGRRVSEYVSLRDVPRTILSLAGVPGSRFPGVSLLRSTDAEAESFSPVIAQLLQNQRAGPHYPAYHGTMWSVLSAPYHYIWRVDGAEELFDIERDPRESHNLARDGRTDPQVLAHLNDLLDAWGRSRRAPRPTTAVRN